MASIGGTGGQIIVTSGMSGAGGINITSSGEPGGVVVFSGTNTYSGDTTVTTGTLDLVGGSQASPITVHSGAALGFTLGSPTTSSSTITFDGATAMVTVTGTPTLASYPLMTASSITGTPVLSAAIPGYALQVTATQLNLISTDPYNIWAALYAPEDLTDRAGDNDNDGLVNQQEFALGLSPVSGSSVNPILIPLNKTTGTFTYQRRAGTGLSYKILNSTTLASGSWTEDTGATQIATDTGGGNESVLVTLSGAPLTGDTLFVRVAAE